MRQRVESGKKARAARPGERGSSVVTFVIALPMLLMFLFAVIDLGRTVFLRMALDDAAHAACRVASERPAEETSVAALERAALAASPALGGEGLRLEVSASYGELEEVTYTHRWHVEGSGEVAERASRARRRSVGVECVLQGTYLTPLGKAFALAEGKGGSSFSYRAQASGVRDETA